MDSDDITALFVFLGLIQVAFFVFLLRWIKLSDDYHESIAKIDRDFVKEVTRMHSQALDRTFAELAIIRQLLGIEIEHAEGGATVRRRGEQKQRMQA